MGSGYEITTNVKQRNKVKEVHDIKKAFVARERGMRAKGCREPLTTDANYMFIVKGRSKFYGDVQVADIADDLPDDDSGTWERCLPDTEQCTSSELTNCTQFQMHNSMNTSECTDAIVTCDSCLLFEDANGDVERNIKCTNSDATVFQLNNTTDTYAVFALYANSTASVYSGDYVTPNCASSKSIYIGSATVGDTTNETLAPTSAPTFAPTFALTFAPTVSPTLSPTPSPTPPTLSPTHSPTLSPTPAPTPVPTGSLVGSLAD
jgi:hypothetical protein